MPIVSVRSSLSSAEQVGSAACGSSSAVNQWANLRISLQRDGEGKWTEARLRAGTLWLHLFLLASRAEGPAPISDGEAAVLSARGMKRSEKRGG